MIARFPSFDYQDSQILAEKFYASIPLAYQTLLKTIFDEAEQTGTEIYLVGGIVRDLLLGRPNFDFDFVCLSYAPDFARKVLPKLNASYKLIEHTAFGTATIQPETDPTLPHFDFATSRREIYAHPAALPTVDIDPPAPLEVDLLRRDFTINAMALGQTGDSTHPKGMILVDNLGGLDDLREGNIRVLHAKSFEDDPTRLIRAVRYAARFGYKSSKDTEKLIKAALKNKLFAMLSPERQRNELRLILREVNPMRALALLQDYNLLTEIHPALYWSDLQNKDLSTLKNNLGADFTIALALGGLVARTGTRNANQIIKDLRFAHEEAIIPAQLAELIAKELKNKFDLNSNHQIYRTFKNYHEWALRSFALLAPDLAPLVSLYLNDLQHRKPQLGGDYLKHLGMKPSPQFKQILDALLDAVMDGKVSTLAEEGFFLMEQAKLSGVDVEKL
jgi:tRNA nucleotidyltransferase (CCA-adding enzyme)